MPEPVLGSGPVFEVQMLTLLTIAASTLLSIRLYVKTGRRRILELAWPPLLIWAVAGTLDVLLTAKAVQGSPLKEANPLARALFTELGPLGPPAASILWITLWASISLLVDISLHSINKRLNAFTQLTLFYSLALGHLYALSGWLGWETLYHIGFTLNQQHPPLNHMISGVFYATWMLEAAALSALHLTVLKKLGGKME